MSSFHPNSSGHPSRGCREPRSRNTTQTLLELCALQMVFQLTIRVGGSHPVADDSALVKRFEELYLHLENATTPTAMLLPWFPSPARKRKVQSTTELYMIMKKDVDDRVKDGKRYEDAVQVLLDAGDDINSVVAASSAIFPSHEC